MSTGAPPDPAAQAAAQAAAQKAMDQFTIEAWTLLGVGILVTLIRTYARVRTVGWKGLQADDYLVWLGVVSRPKQFCGGVWANRKSHRRSTVLRLVLRILLEWSPMG